MNQATALQNFYRRRNCIEQYARGTLRAANAIGPLAHVVQPHGADQQQMREGLDQLVDLTEKTRQAIEQGRQALADQLPPLTPDQIQALRDADQQLCAQEMALCLWLQPSLEPPRKAFSLGEMGELRSTFSLSFEFDSSLDPDSTHLCFPLHFRYRFPPMRVLHLATTRPPERPMPPLFQWAQWNPPPRKSKVPEGLRSELLQRFLEHIPELAHLSGYITGCSLTLENSKSVWQASLLTPSQARP